MVKKKINNNLKSAALHAQTAKFPLQAKYGLVSMNDQKLQSFIFIRLIK